MYVAYVSHVSQIVTSPQRECMQAGRSSIEYGEVSFSPRRTRRDAILPFAAARLAHFRLYAVYAVYAIISPFSLNFGIFAFGGEAPILPFEPLFPLLPGDGCLFSSSVCSHCGSMYNIGTTSSLKII